MREANIQFKPILSVRFTCGEKMAAKPIGPELYLIRQRSGEIRSNEHLMLNALSRASALAEVDVDQCQHLIQMLGRYIQCTSQKSRDSQAPSYWDRMELSSGIQFLASMRDVQAKIAWSNATTLSGGSTSYPLFQAFSPWFESEILRKDARFSTRIALDIHLDSSHIRITIAEEGSGRASIAPISWQAQLEND